MTAFRSVLPVAIACGLVACGGSDESSSSGPEPDPSLLTFNTGEFEVPPGDVFECFYTDTFTEKELSITSAKGQQGPGGHHIVAYWTDTPRDPQHHACNDDEMVSWHQIAGSAGEDGTGAEGLVGLPDGLAIKVPAGKQLVLQAHYINTSGAPMTVNDTVSLQTVEPAEVKAYANYLVFLDEGFEVPPQSTFESSTTCTLTRDFDTVLLLGHMHEFGKHYRLERLDELGNVAETLYDKDWTPSYTSHPPVSNFTYDAPLALKKGMRLRQTCNWDNPSGDPLLFPREMCLAFFYYYPDAGELVCELDPQ